MSQRILAFAPWHLATNEEMGKWPCFDDVSVPETGDKIVAILTGSDHPEIIDLQLDK